MNIYIYIHTYTYTHAWVRVCMCRRAGWHLECHLFNINISLHWTQVSTVLQSRSLFTAEPRLKMVQTMQPKAPSSRSFRTFLCLPSLSSFRFFTSIFCKICFCHLILGWPKSSFWMLRKNQNELFSQPSIFFWTSCFFLICIILRYFLICVASHNREIFHSNDAPRHCI